MATSQYASKSLLDWSCGGAAPPSAPSAHYLALCTGVPTSVAASEGPQARRTVVFAAAATPTSSGVAYNSAVTFAMTTGQAVSGVAVFDAASAGNMLFYGNVTTVRTLASGDSYRWAASALAIVMV